MLFVIEVVPSHTVVHLECSSAHLEEIPQEKVRNNMHHPKVALFSGLLLPLLADTANEETTDVLSHRA
jgi:hypothetical protein